MARLLHNHDKKAAQNLWTELCDGNPTAYKELQAAPEQVRNAIQAALMLSIANHKVERSPFGLD